MSTIEIGGLKYKVIETFSSVQCGYPAKLVEDKTYKPFKERMAVKDRGRWRWWTAKDRLGIK